MHTPVTVKPSKAAAAMTAALQAGLPTFLWGAPGVGKSDIAHQVAANLEIEIRDIRASQLDPTDLRGIPHVSQGRTSWATPDFLPSGGAGLLFLDELNSAPQAVLSACYQLILNRRLGDYVLPDGWLIAAAGNRSVDRAIATRMGTALNNRFLHLEITPDLDDWASWAMRNGVRPEIVAFLRFRPELLHVFDAKSTENAFASPRTWAFVNAILLAGYERGLEFPLIAGCVGRAVAGEFVGFLQVCKSLPDIDSVLADPEGAHVPTEISARHATCTAIAARMCPANVENAIRYLGRLPGEFATYAMKSAFDRDPDISNNRHFTAWACSNGLALELCKPF